MRRLALLTLLAPLAATGCQGPVRASGHFALGLPVGPAQATLVRAPIGRTQASGTSLTLALQTPAVPGRGLKALPASWDTATVTLTHPTALATARTTTLVKGVGLTDNGAGGYVATSPFAGVLRPVSGYSLNVELWDGGAAGALVASKTVGVNLTGGTNAITVALDLMGALVGAPYRASATESTQTDPAIAPGATDALLTWVDTRAVVKTDVYARRAATDGTMPGADTAVTGVLSLAQTLPHLARDASRDQFLVAWQDGAVSPDIHAQVAGPGGAPVGGTLTIATALLGDLLKPRVAYVASGDYYAVIWGDHTGASANVVGQAVKGDGTLWGANTDVASGGGDQDTPDLAHSAASDRTLIVYRDTGGPSTRIRGRIYTGAGNTGGPATDISSDAGVTMADPAVAADPVTGDFMVAYVAQAAPHQIRARKVSATGVLGAVTVVDVAGAEKAVPRVTYVPWKGRFLVTWQVDSDATAAVNHDVRGRYLAVDGTAFGQAFDIATGAGNQTRPELAAQAGGNRVLVSYADMTTLGVQRVYVQRVQ